MFLGIDIGTSAVRIMLLDTARRVLAESRISLPLPQPVRGRIRQQPQLWWNACLQALAQLSAEISLEHTQAIAVDATSATTLLCDANAHPISDALMYNDAGATAAAERIASVAPPGHICRGSSSSLAKALDLLQALPAEQSVTAKIYHQADWISAKLCGVPGFSDYNNCLKLGFDAEQGRWPEWLQALGIEPSRLPQVLAPGTPIGNIAPTWVTQFGLNPATQIVAGTTDSTAAVMACGQLQVGDAVSTIGSSLVLKVLSSKNIQSHEFGVYSHYYQGQWLAGGASNSGAAVLRDFFTIAEIETLSRQIDPQSRSGLDYYPLRRPGERFPIADPQLAPRLSPRPSRDVQYLQGLLEGIAKIEKLGYDRLHELGAPYPNRVLTMGGGANNETWRQIREQFLGVPVHNVKQYESAYGTALLAASIQQKSANTH